MLLSMHVHFLIITYIHISCIFSELVSQYVSVRMTQFFYILIYSIHMKVYCYCPISNCYCTISNCYCLILNYYCPISNCYCLTLNRYCLTLNVTVQFPTVTVWLWTVTVQFPTVTVWTLVRFLTISKVLKLHFKWDWSRYKAKTRGYQFSEGRRTQFYLQDSQNCSSTNQSYCLT
jgi:hypothetical protein